jgi:predicted ATPase/DNA-binding SARP family transcriptional activator
VTIGTPSVGVEVFGGVRLTSRSATPPAIAPGERALLGLLIVHRGTPVSIDRIEDALWPQDSPASSSKIIQIYVSHLRRALGAKVISRAAGGYRLDPTALELDVVRFEATVSEGARELAVGDPAAALRLLDEALALAGAGEPFGDLANYEFVRNEVERLEELRWIALEGRFEAALLLGRERDVLADLQQAVRAQPLRERLWESLLLALYRAGRQADALEAYQALRRTLAEELGIEPGARLEELQRAVLQQDTGLDVPEAVMALPSRLPVPPTSLIGRQDELADVVGLIRGGARLVTLTGPGGTGKTRLAIAAAEEVRDEYPEGVFFADLSPIQDPDLALSSISHALGSTGQPAAAIRDRAVLLILDNLEQVSLFGSRLAELLATCPNLQVLATSRASLHIGAEHEYAVAPLPIGDAAELFIERARESDFRFSQDDAVAQICERLDGLPLAIELAASRVKVLSSAAILRNLDRRLPMLTGGPKDAPERHQTLRTTISWSTDLLEPGELALFRRLSVFAGGCTLDAAISICESGLDEVAALVDHSLLRRQRDRLMTLETIREFAGELLAKNAAEEGSVRARHAQYFHDQAIRLHGLTGQWQPPFDLLIEETDNVRAALAFLTQQPTTDAALELAVTLWTSWIGQGRPTEGDDWMTRAMARADRTNEVLWQDGLETAGELARARGDLERAEQLKEEALPIARRRADDRAFAAISTELGEIALARGDLERARERHTEALALRRSIGQPKGIAHALTGLAELELEEGNAGEAAQLLQEVVSFARASGVSDHQIGDLGLGGLLLLGRARLELGEIAEAANLFAEALRLGVEIGLVDAVRMADEGIAAICVARGDAETAARLLGAGARLLRESGFVDNSVRRRAPTETAARDALGEVAYIQTFAAGAAMSRHEAMELALARVAEEIPQPA